MALNFIQRGMLEAQAHCALSVTQRSWGEQRGLPPETPESMAKTFGPEVGEAYRKLLEAENVYLEAVDTAIERMENATK